MEKGGREKRGKRTKKIKKKKGNKKEEKTKQKRKKGKEAKRKKKNREDLDDAFFSRLSFSSLCLSLSYTDIYHTGVCGRGTQVAITGVTLDECLTF